MNEEQLARRLREEGFPRTFVWQDGPQAFYLEHTHASETAHIVLEGEMTLTMDAQTPTFRAGEPAGAVHAARMGPAGCRYLIGER